MKRRIIASLLSLCLVGGLLPTTALAAEFDATQPTTEQKQVEKDTGTPVDAGTLTKPTSVYAIKKDAPTRGTCGKQLTWELNLEMGTLTIRGTGEMNNYGTGLVADDDFAPWFSYKDSIKTVVMEQGITCIGRNAFQDCDYLSDVKLPESLIKIGRRAFYSCDNLKKLILPDSLQAIDKDAFSFCPFNSIIIPENVITIGSAAFEGTKITSIRIPASVSSLQTNPFKSCSGLKEILVDGNNTNYCSIDGILFSKNQEALIAFPQGKYEFKPVHYKVPDGVKNIYPHAFYNCFFKTLEFPNSLRTISSSAFEGVASLEELIIPNGVVEIESWAFFNCFDLKYVHMANSVTIIGAHAFEYCSNLTDVFYDGNTLMWNNIKISGYNDSLTSATIHYNSTAPGSGTTIPGDRTTVRYLASWDEASRTAVFSDNSHIRYTATADSILPANGVGQFVNRYVLVACAQDENDVNSGQLFRLQPVDSALGAMTSGTDSTVTINGVEYARPDGMESVVPISPLDVLYHTIGGNLAGCHFLTKKTGTAGDWNGSDTVNIGGVDFHTNYMTDQQSLATISKIPDKKQTVIYYFAGDALLKAKPGKNSASPLDPPLELFHTKIGSLTAYDPSALTLQIDGETFSIQNKESTKNTLAKNLKNSIGKKAVFVVTEGKIKYAIPLDRVSTRLKTTVTATPSELTYQNRYDSTSITTTVKVTNVYDVDPWVDERMLEAALSENVPDWNGDITLKHAKFEITWGASDQGSKSVEKFVVFSDGAYKDHVFANDCKTTVENTTVLSLNESATISANIAVNPDYSHENAKFTEDFPNGETEKTAQISVQAVGRGIGGEKLQDSSNCSITAKYPDNILTTEDSDEIAAKAGAELNKLNEAISLDSNTMSRVFGLEGNALDCLEKEILSVIVLSNIPKETLKEKISNDIVDQVIGKYIPKVSASTYTVPLVYKIETPRYGLVTVQFNCKVHTYNLHNKKNFTLWISVDYEILDEEKPVPPNLTSGLLGQGAKTDVGAFASAAYSLAESELMGRYNAVWGNSANKVADFLFGDLTKLIFKGMNTSFKNEVWKLCVWPATNAKIACPVNVFVYDQNNNLCGSIENNVVTKSSDAFGLFVEGETKYVTGLENRYTIKYVATGNGTMDITLTEFSSYETPARQISFYDVPLKTNEWYTQNIPEAIRSETQEYQLTSSSNTIVSADKDQSLLNLTPATPTPSDPGTSGGGNSSSSGGSSSSGYTITAKDADNGTIHVTPSQASRGDTVTVTVTPDTGYKLNALSVCDSKGNHIDVKRQSNTSYTFKMPSDRVTIEAVFAEINNAPAVPFSDVNTKDWFYDAVAYVYENHMMNGTGNNCFNPMRTTTRAMIVTTLYRLEKQPSAGSCTFTDVPSGQWYTDAVAWTAANGIVNGYGNKRFGPNDTITREQVAAILYRYAQFKGYDVNDTSDLSRYADVNQVSNWAKSAMSWANARGLITGNSATTLNPTGSATRAEVAAILMRFAENAGK